MWHGYSMVAGSDPAWAREAELVSLIMPIMAVSNPDSPGLAEFLQDTGARDTGPQFADDVREEIPDYVKAIFARSLLARSGGTPPEARSAKKSEANRRAQRKKQKQARRKSRR